MKIKTCWYSFKQRKSLQSMPDFFPRWVKIESWHGLSWTECNHACLATLDQQWARPRQQRKLAHLNLYASMLNSTEISWKDFFPSASERRVLPIVGVCISSSHLHILSSSHLLIFTSSHLHIFSSSHLLIFTSSHLHIFSSLHLLTSHLLIFTSSHLHIFTPSDLHILTSSHLLLLPSCPLALVPSCPLALSFLSISLLKAGAGAVPTRRHETQPFRTKRGSIAKNWSKIAISQGVPRNSKASFPKHSTANPNKCLSVTTSRWNRTKTEAFQLLHMYADLPYLAASEPAKHKLHGFVTHPQQQNTT